MDRRSHILLAGIHDSPETVTQAIHVFKKEDKVAFDEIHVVTNLSGERALYRGLFGIAGRQGWLDRVCREVKLQREAIVFGARTIHVFAGLETNAAGSLELTQTADAVFELVRSLCARPDSALTIAVSSKALTAALLLHGALAIVGRPDDHMWLIRLCQFPQVACGVRRPVFFPRARRRGGRSSCPPFPSVTKIEIPVVLSDGCGDEAGSCEYVQLGERRRRARRLLTAPADLVLDCSLRQIVIAGTVIRPTPVQLFWYVSLAAMAPERIPMTFTTKSPVPASDSGLAQKLAQLRRTYARLFPRNTDRFDAMLERACGSEPGLPSVVSKINATLKPTLGEGARAYLVQGGRNTGGYRVCLDRKKIRIIGFETASAPE